MNIHEFFAQNERKDLLRVLTCGSVDDGKSTLIGRLLHDSKLVYEDQLSALQRDSARRSSAGAEVDYSLLLDGLKAEREQGITIDVAYRFFSTPRRKFIVADCPGHVQYTRNMATGASTADLAIVLIDARHGILPQTRRHSFIVSLLGIRHVAVAINKMDAVDYQAEIFERIRAEFSDFSARLDLRDVHFIPISALKGDNVVERSANLPWYQSGPLLDYLETVHVASDRNLVDLRFPVQYVLRPNLNFRGYCGTVASGVVRVGDPVMALPSGRRSTVKSIVTYDGELAEAFAPLSVTLTLADELDISRGDMLVHVNNTPRLANHAEAMLVWLHEQPLRLDHPYLVKHTTQTVPGSIAKLRYRIDVNTLHRESSTGLELNEIGRVSLELRRPLAYDPYKTNRGTGSFILIDRLTNATVAAGMFLDIQASELVHQKSETDQPASTHIAEQCSQVNPSARAQRLGHAAATVWLTGLPKSGKSTIAFALEARLFERGCLTNVLDGANLRHGISRDLGFSADDRSENLRRAAGVARLCNDAGLITVAAFISPFREDRRHARQTVGSHAFLEVYVKASLAVCEARDQEGLYEKARSGEIPAFSGVTAPFEEPQAADLVLDTDSLTVDQCVDRLVAALEKLGIVPAA